MAKKEIPLSKVVSINKSKAIGISIGLLLGIAAMAYVIMKLRA